MPSDIRGARQARPFPKRSSDSRCPPSRSAADDILTEKYLT